MDIDKRRTFVQEDRIEMKTEYSIRENKTVIEVFMKIWGTTEGETKS